MNVGEWNRRYMESVDAIRRKIPEIRGIVAAYNSNIDAIIHVRTGDLERFLENDSDLRKKLLTKLEEQPNGISSKEGLLVRLLKCIRNGAGEELIVKSKETFTWIESAFRYDQLRMGGQAGIIANTLAKLNVANVIVHAVSLPKAQASLFFDNVKVPTKENERVILKDPMSAARPNDEKMVHYVFEFDKGTRIEMDDSCFESPRANRFVATWDPRNTELEIDPAFPNLKVKSEADRAVLSGYHLLNREYADGSTHIDKIMHTVRQAKGWKEEDPEFFIHLEMGDNRYGEVYASTLNLLSPFVDSLGLNENELMRVSRLMKTGTSRLQETFSAITAFEGAKMILEKLNISMILTHTSDFSFCIIEKTRPRSIKKIQNGVLFGALLAAVRAITGEYNDIIKVKEEAENPLLALSLKGMEEHECLADFLEKSYGASRKDFLGTGYAELRDYFLVFAVSKVTERPATTAGLGDSLVAGYILGVK